MRKLFNMLANTGLATIGNALLITTSAVVAICGIGLTALYLIKYVDDQAPEIMQIKCAIGIEHPDCPDHQAALREMEAEIAQLRQKKQEAESVFKRLEAAENKLNNLRKIDDAVDTVTLFKTHQLGYRTLYHVTIGTVYNRLTTPNPKPSYFCYLDKIGTGAQTTNLYIHKHFERIEITDKMLRDFGVTRAMLEEARSHCKPYLIAGAQQ